MTNNNEKHGHHHDEFERTCFSVSFLLTKHMLLSIMLLMIIWSLVKIPMMDEISAERKLFNDDLPKEYVERIKTIMILGRVITVIVTFFVVLGIIRESVHVFLVLNVFMLFRLISIYYVPYFDNGLVSKAMICIITSFALLFTFLLIRKPDYEEN